jgi:hypothetical protein
VRRDWQKARAFVSLRLDESFACENGNDQSQAAPCTLDNNDD